jgi:glutamate-1-semialdehyde 2,1-aminomutase
MTTQKSAALFERAKQHIPGGVNSPVRAFNSVGGTPVFIRSAEGAYLFDEDGNRYIDYINSWGPMILGHACPAVVQAISRRAASSTSFGAPTELEIEMAELIKSLVPGLDMVRMVNSGTEACMSALRLARGFTRKNKFIKFAGCYHGHADAFLVQAGSGVASLGIQSVPGVAARVAEDTLVAPYNDLKAVQDLIAQHPNDLAAIIIEPVAGNMGCVLPREGFLAGLRALCDKHQIVLIFDEVMTGFRLAPGGAQQLFGIQADLVTFGKIIGGGLPVGAFGGRKEIMQHIAPAGSVYQAGTLSGNSIALIAGFTVLTELKTNPAIYQRLSETTRRLGEGVGAVLTAKGIAHTINQTGSMISFHFGEQPVTDFESARKSKTGEFNRFFHHLLARGVYPPPSAFESWFVSAAITEREIEHTVSAAKSF